MSLDLGLSRRAAWLALTLLDEQVHDAEPPPWHPTRPDPAWGGSPGRYCTWCGRRLLQHRVAAGYSERTGRRRWEVRRDCPQEISLELNGTGP